MNIKLWQDSSSDDKHGSGDHATWYAQEYGAKVDFLKQSLRVYLVGLLSLIRSKETYLSLLPSFVASRLHNSPANKTSKKPTPTSVLDGLRGLSCLGVVIFHWSEDSTFAAGVEPWPATGPRFWHLPIINIFWSGRAQVRVFLTISGYVLSLKCLQGLHKSPNSTPNFTSIASSILRRGIRLYPPAFATVLLICLMLQFGLFDAAREIKTLNDKHHMYRIRFGEPVPDKLPTFGAQLFQALQIMLSMVDTDHAKADFPLAHWTKYDEHLWSVSTEFWTSMYLFLTLMATSRLRVYYRLPIHIILAASCWILMREGTFLFLSGMVLAEVDIILAAYAERFTSGCESSPEIPNYVQWQGQLAIPPYFSFHNFLVATFIFIWILSLYLLSQPMFFIDSTPGYRHLMYWLPWNMKQHPERVGQITAFRGIGAVMFTWTVANTTNFNPFRKFNTWFFANPLSLYIGEISYGVYLLHGAITRSAGYVGLAYIYKAIIPAQRREELIPHKDSQGKWIKNELTSYESFMVFTIGLCFWLLPLIVWAADLLTRFVDVKSIKLASWCEKKMLQQGTQEDTARGYVSLPKHSESSLLSPEKQEPKLA